ncbi:MAG: 3'(2'),5'-bisphosphate nucleotidase CysQ [Planctomycetes bacterium]|jgi:3'(2'), 5'-bisphosphate nucleotidase|nr:3'(2'),5'-bisphosphate nucleotidase CysQ [Phycisphaerae bacterium]NBB95078.1 3'(2'),5'-bisphosphate nucleotidase CysQ [Planctomycetota bacterium]
MNRETLQTLLTECRDMARRAGLAIKAVADEPETMDVEAKGDGSPLTRADRASHDVIRQGLDDLQPHFDILSEEGEDQSYEAYGTKTHWLVDPLDGTKEFIARRTDYTVNIALVENCQPILGVIYAPAHKASWFAAAGCGAFKQIHDDEPLELTPSTNEQPTSAVASRSHLSAATKAFIERNGIETFVQHGSSIKICAVAEGSADIYPRHGVTCLWDTGAGAAIAREAGCRIVDLAGEDLIYDPGLGIKREGFIVFPNGMTFER